MDHGSQETNERIKDKSFITVKGIKKTYGPTVAVNDVNFEVERGEVIGLVGANGAGKSVMMRILSGVTCPDQGSLLLENRPIEWSDYSPLTAKKFGVRIVFQELSLCTNLTVYENFYLEHDHLFQGIWSWRKKARTLARQSIDDIFPNNFIDVNARLSSLPIAQQQMVEIARAISDQNLKLLILDEPTSSLPKEQTEQLLHYVSVRRNEGISFIFISHRLNEILTLSNRIYVMQNGSVKWTGTVSETNEDDLINKMGEGRETQSSEVVEPDNTATPVSVQFEGGHTIEIHDLNTKELHQINLQMKSGEIIGIAGLDGSGQREFLKTLFRPKKESKSIQSMGKIAYVTGDRKKEGNFPLWSIGRNMDISKLASGRLFQRIPAKSMNLEIRNWYDQLKVKSSGVDDCIINLSGGNQQKVLIARALMSGADIIILDDPTRGVDIATKKLLYQILKEAAAKGKLIIWYSTEDEEFAYCNRVLVMAKGSIVKELSENEITKENIINASFSKCNEKAIHDYSSRQDKIDITGLVIPLISMLAFFIICGILSPNVFSAFGVDLLLCGAIPLIFVTLSQTFIIGLSHVDMGIGNYVGLINVLCATFLVQKPGWGILALIGSVALYSLMGTLIYARKLPSIVVTLGFSFIWTGIAYTVQMAPGGTAPGWLTTIYNYPAPFFPKSVYIVGLAGLAGFWVYRSRYGTVLRGFGNNAQSMRRSGWSEIKAYTVNYLISGLFGLLGGLLVTAITTASDANAVSSYTLLSVASVVIGGGYLTGGTVSPFGAVFGAITLSLIATLMGFFNISSSYVTAVQGAILLIVLALRLLRKDQEQ
ncbi:MAG TPA: branched-chain amino acid ABC transporter permease [Firmicutes bacterium]|jgi:ribose transport system ATP-binding protein|nr:branched-chain amino acid ABC transporter permease [Bacillota bacterium]